MSTKLGEDQSKMSADVKKTEELSVSLKVSYSDKLETVTFKPSEDLKKGDTVKIIIEKAEAAEKYKPEAEASRKAKEAEERYKPEAEASRKAKEAEERAKREAEEQARKKRNGQLKAQREAEEAKRIDRVSSLRVDMGNPGQYLMGYWPGHAYIRLEQPAQFTWRRCLQSKKEVALMNKDIAKGKMKQAKGNIKEKVGKVTIDKSQLEIPKVCPSCSNPRWDKTARNT